MIDDEKTKYFTFIKIFIICFIGFFVALLITFFIAVDNVYAESISDYKISNMLRYRIGTSGNFADLLPRYSTFTTTGANQTLQLQGLTTLQSDVSLAGQIAILPDLWGRYTICGDKGSFTSGYNVQNTTAVNFINTSIPCRLANAPNYNNTYITFATFKITNLENITDTTYGPNGKITYEADYYTIAASTQVSTSWTILAYELSFNQFPTYSTESETFNKLDTLISAINTLIGQTNNSSVVSAIDGTTSAINNQTTQAHNDSQNEINNANEIAQQQEEQQQVCKEYNIDKKDIEINNSYLNGIGEISTNNDYGITKYIDIKNAKYIKITERSSAGGRYYCFYNENKIIIECKAQNESDINQNITIPNNTKYIRATIEKNTNIPKYKYEICKNGNQAISDKQDETNDILTDDSIDDPSSSISGMEENLPSNSVISDLLTLPIRLFQNVINAIDGQCQTFSLGSLYGTNLNLPCINIQNLIGSQLFGVIDILLSGIFVLSIRKKFVDIFENITSLKNGGNELE